MSAIDLAAFDHLATPILWLDGQARVRDCNAAFSGWLSVGKRRLQGVDIDVLDREAPRLRDLSGQCRLPEERMQALRLQLGFAGVKDRFADAIVVREAEGWRIEWHPRAEFEGEDPALALPAALSVAFKGLAHELRNPLAGLKGAAQLLQKKLADQSGTLPLARLIENEVDRLTQLIDQFMHPAPPKPHAPVNIHGVLETVRQLADAEAGWSVKLVRDYDPSLPEERMQALRLQLGFAGVKDRFADAIVVREAEGWRIEWHPRAEFEGEDPALALPAALSVAFKGLAHELRNPLAGLKGAAQLLQKKLAEQTGTLPLARLIENEVDRLTQLIDQFMHPAPDCSALRTRLSTAWVRRTASPITSGRLGS